MTDVTLSDLPPRPGPVPETRPVMPHQQLTQQPEDRTVREELARRLFDLPEVEERPSGVSVPGARALCLSGDGPTGPAEAFMVGREFAHLHPPPDQSMHLTLPTAEAERAIDLGWAEWHPLAAQGLLPRTVVMVFAPRDEEEALAVEQIVRCSWRFARGETDNC